MEGVENIQKTQKDKKQGIKKFLKGASERETISKMFPSHERS